MRMWIYVVRRAALIVPVLLGVVTIMFVLISSLPTVDRTCGFYHPSAHANACSETIQCPPPHENLNTCPNPAFDAAVNALGLNKPIYVQWAIYMENTFTFQWGYVAQGSNLGLGIAGLPELAGDPVTTVIGQFLPYTIELAALSLFFILVIAIPLGNLSAVNRNRPIDQSARVMSFSGFSLPAFLLGSLVLAAAVFSLGGPGAISPICGNHNSVFLDFYGSWPQPSCLLFGTSAQSGLYPTWLQSGYISSPTGFPTVDAAYHGDWGLAADTVLRLILPALVIAYGTIALLLRFVRNSMLEVMNQDYIRTARAKGLPESSVVKKHAGKNSLNVTITVLGLTFAAFITGFPVIEIVFNLWGVGRLYAFAVAGNVVNWDFAVLFGTTILFTYLVVAANIIVDILYAYLDPRVRLG